MKKLIFAFTLGTFALVVAPAGAAGDCEQMRQEIKDHKRNLLKVYRLKKRLKACERSANNAVQSGGGVTTLAAQTTPAPAAPPSSYNPANTFQQ